MTKTAAANEAAAIKRKLLRAAEEMGGGLDPEMLELVGQWKGGKGSDEKRGAKSGVVVCGTYRWSEGTVSRAAEPVTEKAISYWV
jgi:hypothetical protein